MKGIPPALPIRLLADNRGKSYVGVGRAFWPGAVSSRDDDGRAAMLSAALTLVTLGAVVAAAYLGRLPDALAVVVALLLLPVFVRHPLFLVLAYLLVSTSLFEILPLRSYPLARLGPGLTFRTPDVLICLMLVVSLVRLRSRRRRPMFLAFVLVWSAYVVFRLVYGALIGEAGLDFAANMAQSMVGWVLYLAVVGLIDSPRDLRIFGWFILGIMVVATFYQIAEYAHGGRIVPFPVAASEGDYFTYTPILIGRGVPYLWSRASEITTIGLFLSLAAVLGSRRFLPYGILAALGLLSIALQQIRATYALVALGILVVVLLHRWRARSLLWLLALAGVITLMVIAVTPLLAASYGGGSPVSTWLSRASEISNYSTQLHYLVKIGEAGVAWDAVVESPGLAYGWGKTYIELRGEFSPANVLLVHGFLGVLLILAMYVTVLVKAVHLRRGLRPSFEQALLLGFVAMMVIGLGLETLMSGGVAVMAAVFVDRISAFKADGQLEDEPRGVWQQAGES